MPPSRRQVQRRFPPGGWVVIGHDDRLGLVIGWAPTPPTFVKRSGRPLVPAGWEALVLFDGRVVRFDWETMSENTGAFEELLSDA